MKISNRQLHAYIRKYKPKPEYCQMCEVNLPRDVASKDGTHRRDFDHYLWLCRSCHVSMDIMLGIRGRTSWLGRKHSEETKKKISEANFKRWGEIKRRSQ